jgi:hypothetical protein
MIAIFCLILGFIAGVYHQVLGQALQSSFHRMSTWWAAWRASRAARKP